MIIMFGMGAIRSHFCMKGHPMKVRGDRQICLTCERKRVREYRQRKQSKQVVK